MFIADEVTSPEHSYFISQGLSRFVFNYLVKRAINTYFLFFNEKIISNEYLVVENAAKFSQLLTCKENTLYILYCVIYNTTIFKNSFHAIRPNIKDSSRYIYPYKILLTIYISFVGNNIKEFMIYDFFRLIIVTYIYKKIRDVMKIQYTPTQQLFKAYVIVC